MTVCELDAILNRHAERTRHLTEDAATRMALVYEVERLNAEIAAMKSAKGETND